MDIRNESANSPTHLWTESDMYWLAGLLLDESEDSEFAEHIESLRNERTATEEAADQADLCEDVIYGLLEHGLYDAFRDGHVEPSRFVRLASNPEALEKAREAVLGTLDEPVTPIGGVMTVVMRKYESSRPELAIKMELFLDAMLKSVPTTTRVKRDDVRDLIFAPESRERLRFSFCDNVGVLMADWYEAQGYAKRDVVLKAFSRDRIRSLASDVGLSRTFLSQMSGAV